MAVVTFETAALADAFAKAASIAPTTGSAFDRASGIVMEIDPENNLVTIKATNLDVYLMLWLSPLSIEGGATVWRFPSKVFASVVGTLPIGSGKKVKFYDKGDTLYLESGRTKLNRQLITGDYPEWNAFDPSELNEIENFGGKFKLVNWAASKTGQPPMTGILIGETHMVATDSYRICQVPVNSPFSEPLVVQAAQLGSIIKDNVPVKIGRNSSQLLLMPDDHTQVRLGIIDMKFPPVGKIAKTDYPEEVPTSRDDLLAMITRTKHVAGSSRDTFMTAFFGREEIAFFLDSFDNGMFGDVVEVPGHATHQKRIKRHYNQENLGAALGACPHELLVISYDPDNERRPLYIKSGSDDSTYEAWIAPIMKPKEA